jgi:peptidyl-prolyl cis-trans isomerase D
MLHFIRERAQGWVAWLIVGLISIPFALWGVNSYLTGPSDVIVAEVNGQPIQQVEYQKALQQYRDRMRNMMGEDFDPTMFDGIDVKQNVLEGLIEQKLLILAGHNLGQRVTDKALFEIIKSTAAFQKNGQFDNDVYSMTLARVGLNPAQYEAQLRVDVLTQELAENTQRSVIVTDYDLNTILRLENQTREIAYGVVAAQDQLDQVVVTDEAVRSYYDEHVANYMSPERMVVDYVELSVDELSENITVDDESLKAFYEKNKDQFVGPEQRQASHILIEGDEAEAKVALETITKRLEQGEDFAALATEFSQDTGSVAEGGDLGLFQRGVMDPVFEEAVFSMTKIGEVSEPVKTEFGYHLIKLTAIQTSEGKSFVDARDEVEALYRSQKAEDLFFEQAEKFANLSYENPDNLDVVAEELSLTVKTSQAFMRDGNTTGIATNKKVASVAFSEDVLVNNLNSAVIELSKSDLVVLHKNKHIIASQLPYESVAPAITEQLRYAGARDKAREIGEAILAKLKAGTPPEGLFADNQWHTGQSYTRMSTELSSQILERAFAVARPRSETSFIGFTASNANYIVANIISAKDGVAADAPQEERDGLKSHLARTYGTSELQALIDSLKEEADIKLFKENL